TNNEIVKALKAKINEGVILLIEGASIHDFRMVQGPTHTNVIFDVVVPYSVKYSDEEVKEKVCRMVQLIDNTYFAVINIDRLYIN
ncbi:MAG: cation-efflux pump, partial [Lachnospiraceae bacterium]|nr:cation-efflux pump [Lachnospiraceae bacterium]